MKFLLIIILLFYIIINYLLGKNILTSLNTIFHINSHIYWPILFLLALCPFISLLLGKWIKPCLLKAISWIGYYYIAGFFYVIIFFIISKLISFIFKMNCVNLYIISLCITIILLCVGTFLAQSPYVKDYDISINKASSLDKLNIVMVSDIHLGNIVGKNRLSTMVDMINEQNPDIVLIAGDLIDENLSIVEDENMLPILKDIKSTYGTYMAFGNHDGYTGKLERLKNLLKENNVTVLEDSSLLINDDFYIIGKSCSNMTQKGRDVTEITSSIDPSKPSILISHIPDDVYSAEKSGIDLELCGHTHKGQLFPINLVTNMIFPIDYVFKKFGNTNVIVSSGYGTWGPPIRIGSRSEIVRITCTFNKK